MTLPREELFTENEIIDPNKVIGFLALRLKPIKVISTEELITVLRQMLPSGTGIKITYRRAKALKDCFGINGYFDSDYIKDIEIEVCCSSYKKKIPISTKLKRTLINDIADTLCHESIHRKQFHLRGKESSYVGSGVAERDYYLDPDEMFAYSVNIAHNFYRMYGNRAAIKLNDLEEAVKQDCYLADYYYWFYNDQPFKRLLKMIAQNLDAISEGKVCHRSLL